MVRLVVGNYRVDKETLEKLHRYYPNRSSLLIREFVEALVKAAEESKEQ